MQHRPSKLFRVLSLSVLFCLFFALSSTVFAEPTDDAKSFASLVTPSAYKLSITIEDLQKSPDKRELKPPLNRKIKTSSSSRQKHKTLKTKAQSKALSPLESPTLYGQLTSENQAGIFEKIRALSQIKIWHLRALANLKKRLNNRNLQLIDYHFSDVNDDDQVELIAQSKGENGPATSWIVGVYSIDVEAELKLRYEYAQSITAAEVAGGEEHYKQSIQGLQRGFSLCEAWHADTWVIHECNDIILDKTWQAYVLKQRVENREKNSLSSQMTSLDFAKRKAERKYTRIPDGPFMPSISRKNSFALIYAHREEQEVLDNACHIPQAEASNAYALARTKKDFLELPQRAQYIIHKHTTDDHFTAPITIQAHYNDTHIRLELWLQDDSPVTPAHCREDNAIQQNDHVALWFDLNPDPKTQVKNESWMLEFQKAYQVNPFRHELDQDIVGIAITSDNCVVPLTQNNKTGPQPQISAEQSPTGYRVDVLIPAAFLGVECLSQLDRPQGINFSAVQHDVNATRDRFFTQATSQWQWPDPFSFGQIWLMPPNASPLPKYPLLLDAWLNEP